MADHSFALELESVIIQKFGTLIGGAQLVPDKESAIDVTLQVQEVSIFESIFSPVIRAEIAVYDFIGLFVNFPLTGEEAVFVRYRNVGDTDYTTLQFVIDTIDNINFSDAAREMGYVIKCVSIEAYTNAKQNVQYGYVNKTIPDIVKDVYERFINQPTKKVFPGYKSPNLIIENNDAYAGTLVIPNMSPFAAMNMLAEMCVPESKGKYTYLFYQTTAMYNFRTLQGLFDIDTRSNQRRRAKDLTYVYISNEMDEKDHLLKNEGRVVSHILYNKRHSSLQKLSTGYFHNALFEINIAQKAIWSEHSRVEDINTIYKNKLNTENYTGLAYIEGDDEQSNRTRYTLSAQKEHDDHFPISRMRHKWGKDIIATAAMAQIDMTVVIPGTSHFKAGDLFYLEVPEMHGFNNVDEDDLVSGLFVISEVKHIMAIGGLHSTVLRINKDSHLSSVDRGSRYV